MDGLVSYILAEGVQNESSNRTGVVQAIRNHSEPPLMRDCRDARSGHRQWDARPGTGNGTLGPGTGNLVVGLDLRAIG
jgi:hypothetical protein